MIEKEDILLRLGTLKEDIEKKYKVRRIGLFGSYSRNEQREGSDIDLLVEFHEGADLFDLAGLKNYLEEIFHTRVDIVPARALRDELRQAVFADVSYV